MDTRDVVLTDHDHETTTASEDIISDCEECLLSEKPERLDENEKGSLLSSWKENGALFYWHVETNVCFVQTEFLGHWYHQNTLVAGDRYPVYV